MASAVVLLLLSVAVVGVEENYKFFFQILPHLGAETPKVSTENLAIGRYLIQLFGISPMHAKSVSIGIIVPLWIISCGAVMLRHEAKTHDPRSLLQYCIFIPLILLSMPNSWINYQALLILPILVILNHRFGSRAIEVAALTGMLTAFGILLFSRNTPRFMPGLFPAPEALHAFLVDYRILGTLLIWALLIALVYAERHIRVRPVPEAATTRG